MTTKALRYAGILTLGIAFWAAASRMLNTPEPWDAAAYPWWCLAAILLSAAVGWVFEGRAWAWGVLIMFGQLPVIAIQSSLGSLAVVGIGMIVLLSVPASLASWAVSAVRKTWREQLLRRQSQRSLFGQEFRTVFTLCSEDGNRIAEVREFSNGETYLLESERSDSGLLEERHAGQMVGPFKSPTHAERFIVSTPWFHGRG
ncbi:hypothetical protein E4M02_03070 [Brevundimonas sp. S30B]|uniref:hypothetical protein n=1 Tax=unclassified Brevundimonas TaxID=2622653 RepID=UPI001072D6F4|nr:MULTISPECIES: hypothetical protein [unclassified Brevundimonas]QBX37134.1 hypothetical protein E4M01_04745 [Brevundimonas sp. MF30-B]TFW04071.1 hypothetical protein E4M02_03070 [Brevundimonas sp. S30B]